MKTRFFILGSVVTVLAITAIISLSSFSAQDDKPHYIFLTYNGNTDTFYWTDEEGVSQEITHEKEKDKPYKERLQGDERRSHRINKILKSFVEKGFTVKSMTVNNATTTAASHNYFLLEKS